MKTLKKIKNTIEYRIFLIEDFFYHKKIKRAIKRHNRITHKLFIKQNKTNENS